MKDAFRNSFPDRRGRFQQARLGLVAFLFRYGGLNLLDERSHRIDGGSIPFMSPVSLTGPSNG